MAAKCCQQCTKGAGAQRVDAEDGHEQKMAMTTRITNVLTTAVSSRGDGQDVLRLSLLPAGCSLLAL